MARFQLLLPLAFWAIWLGHRAEPAVTPAFGTAIYLLSLGLLIVLMRRLARRAMDQTLHYAPRAARQFHQAAFLARLLILSLHLTGLFFLGWGDTILAAGLTWHGRLEAPAALASALPVVLGWVGLFWAQYPLDRAVREQNAGYAINAGERAYAAPTLPQYLIGNLRVQVLSLLAPVGLAILLRDAAMLGLSQMGWERSGETDLIATLLSTLIVFIIGPEILCRVLPVQSLPDSPLRRRLEEMCRRLGLRYHDILQWHTHFSFCNAAAMGLVPRFRYILLSDLLLETMDDRQIEAVFAHEAGHVVHRHVAWYLVFATVFFLWLSAAEMLLAKLIWSNQVPESLPLDGLVFGVGVIMFVVVFGSLSRSFERQADLFAARSLNGGQENTPVQRDGVDVFNSALEHVARLNQMPLDASQFAGGSGPLRRAGAAIVHHAATWLHGSIRSRMDYLRSLPTNPDKTDRFDRRMIVLRVALLVALCGTTAWVITTMAQ